MTIICFVLKKDTKYISTSYKHILKFRKMLTPDPAVAKESPMSIIFRDRDIFRTVLDAEEHYATDLETILVCFLLPDLSWKKVYGSTLHLIVGAAWFDFEILELNSMSYYNYFYLMNNIEIPIQTSH